MRVCTITPEYPPKIGGMGYYAYNVCNKLVEKGHRVTVITRGSLARWHHECINGVSVYTAGFLPIYPFHAQLHGSFANRFFKSLEHHFDVVHIHHPLAPLIHTSLPTVVTVHSLMKSGLMEFNLSLQSLTHKIFSQFVFPSELKLLRNATLLTSVSYTTVRELKAFYGFDSSSVKVIGNGVDDEFFVPSSSGKNSSYVLYSGRLTYRKGVIDLVKSARFVCRKHRSAFFVIVGAGPLKRHLTKLVNKMGLSNRVFLVGQVNKAKLLKYYQNAAVLVLASYYESAPNTILEGMACGLPVVATFVGDLPKIVKNGVTGFLVSPKDPETLAEVILRLLRDDNLRKKMGQAAREEVERSYGLNFLSERVLDCYRFIMKT